MSSQEFAVPHIEWLSWFPPYRRFVVWQSRRQGRNPYTGEITDELSTTVREAWGIGQ